MVWRSIGRNVSIIQESVDSILTVLISLEEGLNWNIHGERILEYSIAGSPNDLTKIVLC